MPLATVQQGPLMSVLISEPFIQVLILPLPFLRSPLLTMASFFLGM